MAGALSLRSDVLEPSRRSAPSAGSARTIMPTNIEATISA
jgi:hypothetical protein